jgi:hypothetical protein
MINIPASRKREQGFFIEYNMKMLNPAVVFTRAGLNRYLTSVALLFFFPQSFTTVASKSHRLIGRY